MAKRVRHNKMKARNWVQLGFSAVTNGYVKGFQNGTIYTGSGKAFCLPGLNCYSCPGALGSCPIGSLQAVLASRDFKMSFYITGFLIATGAILGRFVCGWLCPFGLFQDLLNKIPIGKKIRKIRGERYLKLLKYLILAVFVILLPIFVVDLFGQGEPWFCKWICPSGTFMAGWPLAMLNAGIRQTIGFLFVWKNLILILLILLSIVVYRPFCRFLCPLGAVYGFFNPVAFYRFEVDTEKCTGCEACRKVCPMDLPVYRIPNSMECIRCGNCLQVCRNHALRRVNFKLDRKKNNGIIESMFRKG